MSWDWCATVTEPLRRRALRYLVNRYLGKLLGTDIDLEQVELDTCQGDHVRLTNVNWSTTFVNEQLANCPVELIDGFAADIRLRMPINDVINDHCLISIQGLVLTLQIREEAVNFRSDFDASSVFYSMCESLDSRTLAHDCLHQQDDHREESGSSGVRGVEHLAAFIDSLLTRVQLSLKNISVRLEFMPRVETRGLALEINVDTITFNNSELEKQKSFSNLDNRCKVVNVEGVRLFTDAFVLKKSEERSNDILTQSLLMGNNSHNNNASHSNASSMHTSRHSSDGCSDGVDCGQGWMTQVASLMGTQRLTLVINELSDSGLRVDDIRLQLDTLAVHLDPNQVHTLTEILSGLSSSNSTRSSSKDNEHLERAQSSKSVDEGLKSGEERVSEAVMEQLLQQSMMATSIHCEGHANPWLSESLERDEDFQELRPVTKETSRLSTTEQSSSSGSKGVTSPKLSIVIKALMAVINECEESLVVLSGQESRLEALRFMQRRSEIFFNGLMDTKSPNGRESVDDMQKRLKRLCDCYDKPFISVTASLIKVSDGQTSKGYAIDVAVHQLAVNEHVATNGNDEMRVVHVIQFKEDHNTHDDQLNGPDLRLHCLFPNESQTTSITLRPKSTLAVDFELGFIDRIYSLINLQELDPSNCLNVSGTSSTSIPNRIEVAIKTERLRLKFQAPLVDTRVPSATRDFLNHFWSRRVHRECLHLELKQFELQLALYVPVTFRPMHLRACCSNVGVAIVFDEEDGRRIPLATILPFDKESEDEQVLSGSDKGAEVNLKLDLDPEQVLQGKFVYTVSKGGKKTKGKKVVINLHDLDDNEELKTVFEDNDNDNLREKVLRSALEFGQNHNNYDINLHLGEVELLLDSKLDFELVYNRVSNDLALWQPAILLVQKHILNTDLSNLLERREEDEKGFELMKSTIKGAQMSTPMEAIKWDWQGLLPSSSSAASAMPSVTSFHIDTFLSLRVAKLQVLAKESNQAMQLKCSHLKLRLVSSLEVDVGTTMMELDAQDVKLDFGPSAMDNFDLEPLLFFNSELINSSWRGRQECNRGSRLNLTIETTLRKALRQKSLRLALNLQESLLKTKPTTLGRLGTWLSDFFVVEDFPVLGYTPPSVMSEIGLKFDHCLVVTETAVASVRLALGRLDVSCHLMNNGHDLKMVVDTEDLALFLTRNEQDVCISDIDTLDVDITLMEGVIGDNVLDVTLGCNLVRVRTCQDTITLLGDILNEMFAGLEVDKPGFYEDDEVSPYEVEEEAEEATESLIPDLADAMNDLESESTHLSNENHTEKQTGEKVYQELNVKKERNEEESKDIEMFFFPSDNRRVQSIPTKSSRFGVQSVNKHASDEFCILDEEVGHMAEVGSGEPLIRFLNNDVGSKDSLSVEENFFVVPKTCDNIDFLRRPKHFPTHFSTRCTLRRAAISWQVFGGNDFDLDPFTLNEDNVPQSTKRTTLNNEWRTRGGRGRCRHKMVELCLNRLQMQTESYSSDAEQCGKNSLRRVISRFVLIVPTFEILDHVSASGINKLLHLYTSAKLPRQASANMLSLRVARMRSCEDAKEENDEDVNAHLSMQPLRLNVDQDTLFFLVDFVNQLLNNSRPRVEKMDVLNVEEEEEEDVVKKEMVSKPQRKERLVERGEAVKPYIRSFIFHPSLPLRIDYTAKYVDLKQGTLAGLLTGLASLNCSELRLQAVHYSEGILGLDKLLMKLLTDWLSDVQQNQLPALFSGVGPMHALVQIVQGLKDLLLMPLEQYQKDGRILRGLQRGANSFTHTTTLSLLELTHKFIGLIKFAAELALDVMTPEHKLGLAPLPPPSDVREGVVNALTVMRQGLGNMGNTVGNSNGNNVAGSNREVVVGVLRQVPALIVGPVALTANATANVIEGVQNSVNPDLRNQFEGANV